MTVTAVEKLKPSQLSDQMELLADDIDLDTFELVTAGRPPLNIRQLITETPTLERTIDGSSTLSVPVRDEGWKLMRSDYLAAAVDVELDGLWFRLTGADLGGDGDDLTLTFEDREVALLRSYPRSDAKHKGFIVRDATKISRVEFARELIREVKEIPIRFVTPALPTPAVAAADEKARHHARAHGFGPGAAVTVKGVTATPAQLDVLDQVLQAGESLGARRKVLVVGVMVVTQESRASESATNGDHVGAFQQSAKDGWPATRNAYTDAIAFFQAAISDDLKHPNLPYAEVGEDVQVSGQGSLYAQWRTEAEHTVTAWGIAGGANAESSPPLLTVGQGHLFKRGTAQKVNGKMVYTREDNWACLQRIFAEVGWRCFCVSGTIYAVTDADLLASKSRMSITRETEGIDKITGSFDERRKPRRSAFVVRPAVAQLTVTCRIGRWQAPPGSRVDVEDAGPFAGPWIAATIRRDLLGPDGTILLKKPQPVLPELLSPELRTAGQTVYAPSGGGDNGTVDGAAVVEAAQHALAQRDDYRYRQVRPMPASLFSKPFPKYVDCSAFVTLLYKAANAPDPNDLGYNGTGNTGTLWANGTLTKSPQPGDLVFYGFEPRLGADAPSHVAVYLGDGQIANMGGPGDPRAMRVTDIPLTLRGYRTYTAAETPQDRARHRG